MPAPKRILILYQSLLAACGVGTWVEMLAGELEKLGWDVTVGLAWGAKFHDPRRVEQFRPTLKTIWMDGRTGTEEGRLRGIEQALREVQPDVVIATLLDAPLEAVRRLRYRERMPFRLIACNHNNFPLHAACFLANRDVVDLAACVGRVSALGLVDVAEGFSPERVIPIANGIPAAAAPPEGSRTSSGRIGFAARLGNDPNKNAADLFPFFRSLAQLHPTAELWVAGEGELAEQVRSLAGEYPGRVRCFGRLSQAELYRSFYPELDIFVNFAPFEGWPQAIAEAMAHGVVPVISEYFGVHAEGVVRDECTGKIFPVYNTQRAAQIVAELLQDPVRLRRLGRQAADEVRQQFSIEGFGQRWQAALDHLLRLPPLPVPQRPASLDRRGAFGLKETQLETLRRWFGRRVGHISAGDEWPNFFCRDPQLVAAAAQAMTRQEELARQAAEVPESTGIEHA